MSDTEETRTVRGEVILPSADFVAATADVIVQVEDVSRADAPSGVIAENRRSGVPLRGGAVIPFVVDVATELVDERRSYAVRVHGDVSGTGEVSVGDLVSTQSYPVLTRGHGDEARIYVQRV
jgi:putative lipoprotein